MKISLVVTTNNREKIFERLLLSIVENDFKDLELIVINQNQNQINKKVVDKYKNSVKIKYIDIGKQISLSKARNIGNEYCDGDIIGYPDDDCWYHKTFFFELCKKMEEYNLDAICTSVYDPIRKVIYGNKESNNEFDQIKYDNVIKFTTSVGIFIKSKKGIDKFDENLGVGAKWYGGEDIDYVCNMIANGKKIYFINSLKVFHEVESERSLDKEYNYSIGAGAVLSKIYNVYGYKKIYKFYLNRQIKAIIGMVIYIFSKKNFSRYKSKFKGLKFGFKEWKQNV